MIAGMVGRRDWESAQLSLCGKKANTSNAPKETEGSESHRRGSEEIESAPISQNDEQETGAGEHQELYSIQ